MAEYAKVAKASELEPNHGKLVEVQGKKIALFNVDGKFHAIDNTCTHRGGPLSEGELEGDEVTVSATQCANSAMRLSWSNSTTKAHRPATSRGICAAQLA